MSNDTIEEIETNFDEVDSSNMSDKEEVKETKIGEDDEAEIPVVHIDHKSTNIDSVDADQEAKTRLKTIQREQLDQTVTNHVVAPLAEVEADSFVDIGSDTLSDSSGRQLLNSMDSRNDSASATKSASSNSKPSLLALSKMKVSPEGDNNGNGYAVQTEDDEDEEGKGIIYNFFKREYKAFKEEKKKKLRLIPKEDSTIDFGELIREWKGEGKYPERHWKNLAKRRPGEKCPELLSIVLIGIFFTLLPNCFIVLDYQAAYEYLAGNWYLKYDVELDGNETCRNSTGGLFGLEYYKDGYVECFETDEIWGGLTLAFTFLSGFFWSFHIFYRLWTYLTETDRAFYDRKRMLFFFFVPLSILCVVTFPIQLILISLIAVFNDQEQWIFLTIKVGIAEGLFNAHFQFALQLFIFCVKADRHPSTFQFILLFGSLVFLSYSRIESLLLDRGGPRMSPGQRIWWIVRFAPSFLFNCAFKLGSLSLILAMLRFNSIWLYGSVILIWLLLQILFNEQKISRSYYYLFLGAGMHAVTVAHVPEYIKIIDTDPDIRKNVLWSSKLNSRELRMNVRFQNFFWFLFNTIILSSVWVTSVYIDPKTPIQVFWPFTPYDNYTFTENKVFKVIHIVAPVIIICGVISQIIIWFFEERPIHLKDIVNNRIIYKTQDSTQTDTVDAAAPSPRRYEGWRFVETDTSGRWHKHVYDHNLDAGVQGKFNQIIYPLLNIWESFGDKNISGE